MQRGVILCLIFLLCCVAFHVSASIPINLLLRSSPVTTLYQNAPQHKRAQFVKSIFSLNDHVLLADSEFFSLVKRFLSHVYHQKCHTNPKFCNNVIDKVLEAEEELSDVAFGFADAKNLFNHVTKGCKRNPERCILMARSVIGLSDELAVTFGDALWN